MSGCFVEDKDPETQEADGTASGTASGTGTSGSRPTTTTRTGTTTESSNATNQAPVANLTADPGNGTAPLNVTFTVAGSDPDGDALNWTLTMGNTTLGNGTTLPSNVTHQFTQAGNFTVVLMVSDGQGNATANVTIQVTGGGSAPAPPAREDAWVVFLPDGTCDAKGEIDVLGAYIHERGDPPGTGYVAGDGTWVYEESNNIDGLQVGGADEVAAYQACLNPDTLIF